MQAKNIVIALVALVLLGAIGYLLLNSGGDTTVIIDDTTEAPPAEDTMPVEPDGGIGDGGEPLPEMMEATERGEKSTIGNAVSGTDIVAYHFGSGEKEVLLVAGAHGGYSPNTTELAEELVAHYKDNEADVPENITLTIIPLLNPDGATKSGTPGRFNANTVDLNRNFDCEWSATAKWRDQDVSGGSAAFSEPEAAALRDYVMEYDPEVAIVWFSAEGKVYPSACAGVPSKASVTTAATFATAAGYPAEAEFDAYAITGDMVNWMAKEGVAGISVLLSDHEGTEFAKNLKGVQAVLDSYAE